MSETQLGNNVRTALESSLLSIIPNNISLRNFPQLLSERFFETFFNVDTPLDVLDDSVCRPQYVIFRKSLNVTNISIIEFAALINNSASNEIKLIDRGVFSEQLAALVSDYSPSSLQAKNEHGALSVKSLTNSIGILVQRTLPFELFTNSMVLYPHPGARIDLQRVVGKSGYVYCAGPLLYSATFDTVENEVIASRLGEIDTHISGRLFLTVLADEFIDPFERETSVTSKRSGLDSMRLKLRRHHIGSESLYEFLSGFEFSGSNFVIPAGSMHYRDERELSVASKRATIFMCRDELASNLESSFAGNPDRGSPHFIVFAQRFVNWSQLILFKERKPGWVAPVTLPHTLSAAMINCAIWKCVNQDRLILDPFVGSGTLLFDGWVRAGPNDRFIGLDRNPMMPMMIMLNAWFFSLSEPELEELFSVIQLSSSDVERLSRATSLSTLLYPSLGRADYRERMESLSDYKSSRAFSVFSDLLHRIELTRLENNCSNYFDTIQLMLNSETRSRMFSDRLDLKNSWLVVSFLMWRAIANGAFNIRSDLRNASSLVVAELQLFVREMREMSIYLRSPPLDVTENTQANFKTASGLYSDSITVRTEPFANFLNEAASIEGLDVQKASSSESGGRIILSIVEDSVTTMSELIDAVDILVTDPPYGFNTDEGADDKMRAMFDRFVVATAHAVRRGGAFAIALPRASRTGKKIPFFETSHFVEKALESEFLKRGKRCITHRVSYTGQSRSTNFPITWNSINFLSRSIIVGSVS